jgi:hypothetical protein
MRDHGRLQQNTHSTRHEHFLCHGATHGTLQFFSFAVFPHRIVRKYGLFVSVVHVFSHSRTASKQTFHTQRPLSL